MSRTAFKLIVHGGAWDIPPDLHEDHLRGIEAALSGGLECLSKGTEAVGVVRRVLMILEDDPTFDAGKGSFLNKDGEVEMDAMIMDGRDLSFGAVAAIRNVKNPIAVADTIRSDREHVLLAGDGAGRYAYERGFPFYPTENLLVGRELERYRLLKHKKHIKTRQFFESRPGDTVGAVARDCNGNIAAATSTGGTPNKLPGRVGDSPVIGAGTYADNLTAGASSTGLGESIMKVLLAKTTCDLAASVQSAQRGAEDALKLLAERVDGLGGVICIDAGGAHGFAYNTPFMARGIADQDGIKHIGI